MAVKIRASNPADLLSKIKKAINEGRIKTWNYETYHEKQYFTHVTSDNQWRGKAWLLPKFEEDLLVLNIITPQNLTVSTVAYAVYHGRFIEMLLTHFENEFSVAWATALPESGDVVK